MTSFDMHGASLTILNVTGASPELVEFLDYDTDAPAWSRVDIWSAGEVRASSIERPEVAVGNVQKELTLPPLAVAGYESLAKDWVLKAAASLAEHESMLTQYDTIVGDGDCGITMKRGATEGRHMLRICFHVTTG